jgi:hypothetical protein
MPYLQLDVNGSYPAADTEDDLRFATVQDGCRKFARNYPIGGIKAMVKNFYAVKSNGWKFYPADRQL